MKKYDLLRSSDSIIRVLEIQGDRVLVIDCIKRTMPVWIEIVSLESYSECTIGELSEVTGVILPPVDDLDTDQRKIMYARYTMIASILPFVSDDRMRSKMICSIATEYGVSKATIRNYLCLYLAYMDIAALAPKRREDDRALTQDEKYMRWALNKFFYTTKKHSLMTAYTLMLKEKYCDSLGTLAEEYPSFYQFRYFYRKTRKLQNFYISRDGLKNYQRNNRPLTGEGVQEFAPAVGVGMLDATVCDIYLINDAGNLVGRPILTACIDAYSSLCCGYSLSWEGGVYSLRGLMLNIIADKVSLCQKFGISIQKDDWDCDMLPATFITDMGSEYKSGNFEQIAELGVTVVNLPSYRPELKGLVEKFFDLVQESYKKHLKGRGVIEPDYQERGAHDYRKDACLTMTDFEKIILHCIIYYNSQRIIESFPYTEDMIAAQVKPYASQIWNWGKSQIGANRISVGSRELMLTLLPRTTGRFSRYGLKVNKLRYHCEGYTEKYLSGGTATVAYNPEDVTSVWVLEDGTYTEFTIIESRFEGKDLTAVQELQTSQRAIAKGAVKDNLQAQINTKIIPCICVQCPFDSSVKGLLLEVLRKVDEAIDSNYYQNALRARATTDMLVGSVSQVALNHIGLLVVDEIQNVCNSKNGKSLVGMLTQLINNSGISICMVGTPESAVFFEQAMQLARRSLGLRYDVMEYGDNFKTFCEILYSYQYVKRRTEITDAIMEWLYEHTSGNISVVVSLIHDAQEIVILNGREVLNVESLNEAYQQRLSLLHGFIQPGQKKQTSRTKRKVSTAGMTLPVTEKRGEFTIAELVSQARADSIDIVQLLKVHMPVVEVAV